MDLTRTVRSVTKAGGWCHSVSDHPTQPMFMAAGHSDGSLLLWDRRKAQYPLARLKQHSTDVWAVRFHPTNPDRLFSCAGDGTVLQWDFNPRGVRVCHPCVSRVLTARLQSAYGGQGFRVDEGKHVVSELARLDGGVNAFDIGGPDGDTLAAVSENEALCFLQLPR